MAFLGAVNQRGIDAGFRPRLLVLGIGLLLASVAMSVALMLGRRLVAAAILALEAALGIAIVVRALDESVHSDQWIWVGALVVGAAGIGALAAAELPAGRERLPG